LERSLKGEAMNTISIDEVQQITETCLSEVQLEFFEELKASIYNAAEKGRWSCLVNLDGFETIDSLKTAQAMLPYFVVTHELPDYLTVCWTAAKEMI
jgi:hypothetical protein